jgi:putative endonuclease
MSVSEGECFVYVLRSESSGKLYVGQTKDLATRILQHNQGLSPYTKGRGPWKLAYFEQFKTRSEAVLRERFFKSGTGRQFMKSQLEESA